MLAIVSDASDEMEETLALTRSLTRTLGFAVFGDVLTGEMECAGSDRTLLKCNYEINHDVTYRSIREF